MLCVLFLCSLIAGCGGRQDYDGPQRFSLSGSVTLDDQPVENGTIAFLPATDNQRPAGGVIQDGTYSIPESKGVNEGTYTVEIRWSRPTGEQVRDVEDTGEMIDVVEEAVPARYNTQSELSVSVTSGKTSFDFELEAD
jgi:hypothetical protein